MRISAKMLSGCLILIGISGCTKTIYVPQKCTVPTVEKPLIQSGPKADAMSASKQCLLNYSKMKAYAAKLEEANKVCR